MAELELEPDLDQIEAASIEDIELCLEMNLQLESVGFVEHEKVRTADWQPAKIKIDPYQRFCSTGKKIYFWVDANK